MCDENTQLVNMTFSQRVSRVKLGAELSPASNPWSGLFFLVLLVVYYSVRSFSHQTKQLSCLGCTGYNIYVRKKYIFDTCYKGIAAFSGVDGNRLLLPHQNHLRHSMAVTDSEWEVQEFTKEKGVRFKVPDVDDLVVPVPNGNTNSNNTRDSSLRAGILKSQQPEAKLLSEITALEDDDDGEKSEKIQMRKVSVSSSVTDDDDHDDDSLDDQPAS